MESRGLARLKEMSCPRRETPRAARPVPPGHRTAASAVPVAAGGGPGRPHGPPDVGALAREAVISFLQDASKATAERESARTGAAAPGAGATVTAAAGNPAGDGASTADAIPAAAPEPEAMPPGAISAASDAAAVSAAWRAALDRIEAAAAKVEEDIAVAHRAYAELQAGAGAAAKAAVRAAESAMASAGTAVEAERRVRSACARSGKTW